MNIVWNTLKVVWCAGAAIQTCEWIDDKLGVKIKACEAFNRMQRIRLERHFNKDVQPEPIGALTIEDQLDSQIHTREIEEHAS